MSEQKEFHYSDFLRGLAAAVMVVCVIAIFAIIGFVMTDDSIVYTISDQVVTAQDDGTTRRDIVFTFHCNRWDNTIVGYADIRWNDDTGEWVVDEEVDVMQCQGHTVQQVGLFIDYTARSYVLTTPSDEFFQPNDRSAR